MTEQIAKGRFEEYCREEFADHERRIRLLEVDNTINKQHINALLRAMEKIESNTTWILRLVIGIIVAALLGLIIKGGN